MARIKKNAESWHAITLSDDGKSGHLTLIKGGPRRTYLWAGKDVGQNPGCVVFSGPRTLRKLAYAILKEVGRGEKS